MAIKSGLKSYYFSNKIPFLKTIPKLFLFILPIILAIPQTSELLLRNQFIIVSVIVILILSFLIEEGIGISHVIKQQKLESQVEKYQSDHEILKQSLESLPEDYIRYLFDELELDNHNRISLYVIREESFKIIGRFAKIDRYKGRNRTRYPLDEGYISQVWEGKTREDFYHKSNLPDPERNIEDYIKEVQADTNMEVETIENLTMKSRAYYVKILRIEQNSSQVGIIVIESVRANLKLGVKDINDKLDGTPSRFLSKLIEINSR